MGCSANQVLTSFAVTLAVSVPDASILDASTLTMPGWTQQPRNRRSSAGHERTRQAEVKVSSKFVASRRTHPWRRPACPPLSRKHTARSRPILQPEPDRPGALDRRSNFVISLDEFCTTGDVGQVAITEAAQGL